MSQKCVIFIIKIFKYLIITILSYTRKYKFTPLSIKLIFLTVKEFSYIKPNISLLMK